MIEVLVAVLVIGIGLLGLARLQAVGINNGYVSHLRSIASIHTENMAEFMRANIGGVDANVYAQGADPGSVDYATIDPEGDPPFDCRSAGASCTPIQQAQTDAFFWIRSIARDLPDGTGSVACNDREADSDNCTDGSSHTITVRWREKDIKDGDDEDDDDKQWKHWKSFETVFRP